MDATFGSEALDAVNDNDVRPQVRLGIDPAKRPGSTLAFHTKKAAYGRVELIIAVLVLVIATVAVPSGLDKDIEDLALAVDGSPQVQAFALDRDHHLIQMSRTGRSRTKSEQIAGIDRSEFENPAPGRLRRDLKPALGEQFLDAAVAEREA